jgi:hypothetical protein
MVLFMGAQRWDRMVFVAGTTKRWCGGATGSVLRWSASGQPPSRPRDAPAFRLTGTQRFVVFGGITSSRWPGRPVGHDGQEHWCEDQSFLDSIPARKTPIEGERKPTGGLIGCRLEFLSKFCREEIYGRKLHRITKQ